MVSDVIESGEVLWSYVLNHVDVAEVLKGLLSELTINAVVAACSAQEFFREPAPAPSSPPPSITIPQPATRVAVHPPAPSPAPAPTPTPAATIVFPPVETVNKWKRVDIDRCVSESYHIRYIAR